MTVLRCVWLGAVSDKEWRRKLGRTGRQDKSRDVRLGRSGRWRLYLHSFDMHPAMCARGSRCAATRDRLKLFGRAHLAGAS
jgi:hypothetical protein